MASQLYKDDDPSLSTVYWNEFVAMLEDARNTAKKVMNTGFDEFINTKAVSYTHLFDTEKIIQRINGLKDYECKQGGFEYEYDGTCIQQARFTEDVKGCIKTVSYTHL